MKKTITIALIIAAAASCGKNETVFTVPDYKKWEKPAGRLLERPVPGHGSTFRIIYANENASSSSYTVDSSGKKSLYMKSGSIIVKEVYTSKEDIGRKQPDLTIMVKDPQDPESINGWNYYMEKSGEKPMKVTSRMCVGCHEAANEKHPYFDGNPREEFRDYLFAPIVK